MGYKQLGKLPRLRVIDILGVESSYLQKCNSLTKRKFYLAGVSLILTGMLTLLSLYYAFMLLFNNAVIQILLSSFVSVFVLIIYILLINTFSKDTLTNTKNKYFSFSNVSRIGFVVFIAFIISKPIEIYIYEDELETQIEDYKAKMWENFNSLNQALYNEELVKFKNERKFYENELQYDDSIAQRSIDHLNELINNAETKKMFDEKKAKLLIERSNFFLKRVIITSTEYSFSWLICSVVICFFLLPGFLVYFISGENHYYSTKRMSERSLVLTDYSNFKILYSNIFRNKYNIENISFHENFLDAPFNTIKKPEPTFNSQDDFIKKVFHR